MAAFERDHFVEGPRSCANVHELHDGTGFSQLTAEGYGFKDSVWTHL